VRDTLLRAAHAGLCRTCYSAEILEEVRRNLVEKQRLSTEAAQRTIDRLRTFPHKEIIDTSRELIPLLAADPEDSHVLAVAIRAKADVIVTINVRHFPPAVLSAFQIQAQSPNEFLANLFGESPGLVTQIITEQAAALTNPPLTRDQVLTNLARVAPSFVRTVRDYIAANPDL
jgi:predicted nucleic acid-binding protein